MNLKIRKKYTLDNRPFLAPEVVQTSSMDCGPASLKSLLEGFGISVSYGRLREACQTDVDGTSIDTLEEVATAIGTVEGGIREVFTGTPERVRRCLWIGSHSIFNLFIVMILVGPIVVTLVKIRRTIRRYSLKLANVFVALVVI